MPNEMIILSWKMGGYSWNYWLSEYGGETAVVLDGLKKIRDCQKARTQVMSTCEIIRRTSFPDLTSGQRRLEAEVKVEVPRALWEKACRRIGEVVEPRVLLAALIIENRGWQGGSGNSHWDERECTLVTYLADTLCIQSPGDGLTTQEKLLLWVRPGLALLKTMAKWRGLG